jgi:hypothetical protein
MSFTQFLSSHAGSRSKAESLFRPWPKIAIDCIRNINYVTIPEVTISSTKSKRLFMWGCCFYLDRSPYSFVPGKNQDISFFRKTYTSKLESEVESLSLISAARTTQYLIKFDVFSATFVYIIVKIKKIKIVDTAKRSLAFDFTDVCFPEGCVESTVHAWVQNSA